MFAESPIPLNFQCNASRIEKQFLWYRPKSICLLESHGGTGASERVGGMAVGDS